MAISSVGVSNAYNYVQKLASQSGSGSSGASGTSGAASTSGGGFGDLVTNALKDGVDTIKKSEAVSMQAVAGKANINDVVSAVNSADIALKTIVSVRDKVIGAYQDIIKMPI